jgi:hypothetical protein
MFTQRGVAFDGGMYLWEAVKRNPAEIFALLPNYLVPFYHWYNVPCNTKRGDQHNPLHMIKTLCKQSDFVVFKLDIDSPGIELELMKQLAEDDTAIGLVCQVLLCGTCRRTIIAVIRIGYTSMIVRRAELCLFFSEIPCTSHLCLVRHCQCLV